MIYFGKTKVASSITIDDLYPVGSVYATTVNSATCPIQSGTWTKISTETIDTQSVTYWKRTA